MAVVWRRSGRNGGRERAVGCVVLEVVAGIHGGGAVRHNPIRGLHAPETENSNIKFKVDFTSCMFSL